LKQLATKLGVLFIFIYLAMGVYLYVAQRSFLYFHTQHIDVPYPTLTLENDGESINVIVVNKGKSNAILYFGGNAESMAQSTGYLEAQFPEFTTYMMDYRGYGASSGVPTEQALYMDALKLYDTIATNHKRICVGGRSLGSGVATYVASKREVSKLALITPFDSIVAVAKERYPMYPVSFLLKDRYDSVSRAKDIKAKTFIIMAEKDKVIPRENTQNLIDAFLPKQRKVTIIKNRGHRDISSDDKYYKIMQDFIAEG
jgi:esterase/lipase